MLVLLEPTSTLCRMRDVLSAVAATGRKGQTVTLFTSSVMQSLATSTAMKSPSITLRSRLVLKGPAPDLSIVIGVT